MSRYRLDVLAPAEQDLINIWSWLATEASPAVADRMLDRLYDRFKALAAAPLIGLLRPDLPGSPRSSVIAPYVIFYHPMPGGAQIRRILHGARRLEDLL